MFRFPLASWILTAALTLACACAASPGAASVREVDSRAPQSSAKELETSAEAAFQRKDWKVAADGFERSLALDPSRTRGWMQLGHCRMMLGDHPRAIEAYAKVTSGPAVPIARYDIACALALDGKRDAALDALDRAVEAGFNDASTFSKDPDLESLRDSPRFAAALAKVQSAAPAKFEPPAEARQFDFWIGDWNVVNAAGNQAGTSRIEKILNGCALQENWTSAQGNSGKSFNRFDPVKREWRQHWIDDSGLETFYAGSFLDKCMSLTSEQTTADGKQQLNRMRFFDLGAEGVRQWGEVSDDAGAHWKTTFDLYYRRK